MNLKTYETLNDLLLLQWNDETENALPLKSLRDNCPCANCAGETDVFGNIYKGELKPISKEGFILKGLQPVGYYALRPFWLDGHHAGIYSFEMLRTLCENQDKI